MRCWFVVGDWWLRGVGGACAGGWWYVMGLLGSPLLLLQILAGISGPNQCRCCPMGQQGRLADAARQDVLCIFTASHHHCTITTTTTPYDPTTITNTATNTTRYHHQPHTTTTNTRTFLVQLGLELRDASKTLLHFLGALVADEDVVPRVIHTCAGLHDDGCGGWGGVGRWVGGCGVWVDG